MIWEIFLSAYNSIKANKIRSLLTIIGIVIGIASVIAISGLGEGSKKSVNDNLAKLGTNRITIATNYRSTITPKDKLSYSDEEFLRAYEEIEKISPVSTMNTRYEIGTNYYSVTLKGVNIEAAKIENLEILYGSFFDESQAKAKSNVIVIDDVFAKTLFKTDNVVGENLKLKLGSTYKEFMIIGVYKNSNSSANKSTQNLRATAYTSINLIDQLNPKFEISQYQATVKDINKIDEISTNIVKMLEIKHRNYNKYNVSSVMERMEDIKLTLDNDTFENTGKSRFFERRTSRVLY